MAAADAGAVGRESRRPWAEVTCADERRDVVLVGDVGAHERDLVAVPREPRSASAPRAASMSQATTRGAHLREQPVVANPMPEAEPVTSATRSRARSPSEDREPLARERAQAIGSDIPAGFGASARRGRGACITGSSTATGDQAPGTVPDRLRGRVVGVGEDERDARVGLLAQRHRQRHLRQQRHVEVDRQRLPAALAEDLRIARRRG